MTHLEIVPVTHESKLGDFVQQTRPIEKCILLEGRHVARVSPFLPELVQIIIFHLDPYWPAAWRRSLLLFPHIVASSGLRRLLRCPVAHALLQLVSLSALVLLHGYAPKTMPPSPGISIKGVPRKNLPSAKISIFFFRVWIALLDRVILPIPQKRRKEEEK